MPLRGEIPDDGRIAPASALARAEAGRDNDRRQNDAKHASDHAQARWPERVLETHHEEMKFFEGLERQSFAKEICGLTER